MKRVVVTGMGIWSCIGQNLDEVSASLREGRSGIISDPGRLGFGLRCSLVGNVPMPDLKPFLDRRTRLNMSEDAGYAFMAAREAFAVAGISEGYLRGNEVGIIFGNDGNVRGIVESLDAINTGGSSMYAGSSALFKSETSSVTMNLGSIFHLTGINFCVGAACSSSSHAIGIGMTLIRQGLQDVILAGGSMETFADSSVATDALDALSLKNDSPLEASRPFDKGRDGMVPSGGAAALVLEEYEHARARGAEILAEVVGYGFSCNGNEDISRPDSEGEYIAMKRALDDAGISEDDVDYVNAHATSTLAGDSEEAHALSKLFSGRKTMISSTKSMTGHENWMAGASETVYCILMMRDGFVAPNINLVDVDDSAAGLNIVRKTENVRLNYILNNSSGMGGTNSAIVIKRV
ncbi:MAG: beta-ketoacyl-[acyl-carrier-protein] synthase family protein [Bacteroidales bacterium]|nr:beta-ketoacyl-[acyl-carrier-protein] synthase family protein [Bacteroidales bacterium]